MKSRCECLQSKSYSCLNATFADALPKFKFTTEEPFMFLAQFESPLPEDISKGLRTSFCVLYQQSNQMQEVSAVQTEGHKPQYA